MRCRQKQTRYALGNPARGGAAGKLELRRCFENPRIAGVAIREEAFKKTCGRAKAPATLCPKLFPNSSWGVVLAIDR
jgi:hypothetical protein